MLNPIFLQGPAGQLEVKAAQPKNQALNKVTVICCHPHPLHGGTMENKVVTTVFRAFNKLGAAAVRFNYRGVGQSEGKYAHAIGETQDLLAVIQWVRQLRPEDAIWLAGFSFGAYVVYRAAGIESVQQLLTIAPAVENVDFNELPQPACPWVLIQPDQDEVVSPEKVYQWVDSLEQKPQLIRVAESSHFFHGKLVELKQILEQVYAGEL